MKKSRRVITLLLCTLLLLSLGATGVAAANISTVGLTLCQGDYTRQTEGISAVTVNDTLCVSMAQLARQTGASVTWDGVQQVAIFENHSGTALIFSGLAAVYKIEATAPAYEPPAEEDPVPEDPATEDPEAEEPSAEESWYSDDATTERLVVAALAEGPASYDGVVWEYSCIKQSKYSVMVNDSRYLPLSYLTALGYQYDWDGKTLTLRVAPGACRYAATVAQPPELDKAWRAIKADIAKYRENQVIATYSTNFNTGQINRSTNLRLATNAINGTVVQPGAIFSFNNTVGPRTYARGYRSAIVFVGGAQVYGLGGGICQVSSTLYNVCLNAGMTIIERRPHGLPVYYVPPGRDATVSWGTIDFRFKNNRDYPIKIVAGTSGGTLTISFKRA